MDGDGESGESKRGLRREPTYRYRAGSNRNELPVSPRELEALRWFSYGLTYRMVAEMMGVSMETTKSTVRSARGKLGAKTTAHAVANAIRAGILR